MQIKLNITLFESSLEIYAGTCVGEEVGVVWLQGECQMCVGGACEGLEGCGYMWDLWRDCEGVCVGPVGGCGYGSVCGLWVGVNSPTTCLPPCTASPVQPLLPHPPPFTALPSTAPTTTLPLCIAPPCCQQALGVLLATAARVINGVQLW